MVPQWMLTSADGTRRRQPQLLRRRAMLTLAVRVALLLQTTHRTHLSTRMCLPRVLMWMLLVRHLRSRQHQTWDWIWWSPMLMSCGR